MFADHLYKIESLNASKVMTDYANNATVAWFGQTAGFGGVYHPAPNITRMYVAFFREFANLTITNETEQGAFAGSSASVNASFYIDGQVPATESGCGRADTYNGTVQAQVTLIPNANSWQILDETWDFVHPFTTGICA